MVGIDIKGEEKLRNIDGTSLLKALEIEEMKRRKSGK